MLFDGEAVQMSCVSISWKSLFFKCGVGVFAQNSMGQSMIQDGMSVWCSECVYRICIII